MTKKKQKYNQMINVCESASLEYCISKHCRDECTKEEWNYIKRLRNRNNLYLKRYLLGIIKFL